MMLPSPEPPTCWNCAETDQLRPYGPGGAWTCFPCATATPEREAQAARAFGALLDGNQALSPTKTTILTGSGPAPFDARKIDPNEEARRG